MVSQALILAGGLGTRLRPLTYDRPKPMIEFHGKPFLEYLIEDLRDQGIKRFVIAVGYLAEVITDYFGNGNQLDVEIIYSYGSVEDQTGQRVLNAKELLDETFLLCYCDNICPLNLRDAWDQFQSSPCDIQLSAYQNNDSYTKSNLKINRNRQIEVYDKSRTNPNLEGVEIGYAFIRKRALSFLPRTNCSFETEIYPQLVQRKKLGAYITSHRYYSVGSHQRLPHTNNYLKPQKGILLDRDGVLNQKAGKGKYITNADKFIWMEGAQEALRLLTELGYRIAIITNQAGIALGQLSHETLNSIHQKMLNEAKAAGGVIENIYCCPHHWDESCSCRKPEPGMLFQAQREMDLDLRKTWFLGDDERDGKAAEKAGCLFELISEKNPLLKVVENIIYKESKVYEDTYSSLIQDREFI